MAWKRYFTFLRLLIKVPFSHFWEHHFQLPRFFALLRTSLSTAKKVPFFAFHEIAWNRKKGTFFCALKHRLVKREMDERTILTSKYHSLESWKYLTSFSNKRYLFLTFILNDKHRQKRVTILYFVHGKWMQKVSFSTGFN